MEQETKPEELSPEALAPKHYKKRPLEVLAVQILSENKDLIHEFLDRDEWAFSDEGLLLRTYDGEVVRVRWGDWVIKEEGGWPYVCQNSAFSHSYEPI